MAASLPSGPGHSRTSPQGSPRLFLDTVAAEIPPAEGKTVHLVLDNASWHKATALKWHHLKAVYLPPYSPDFNPIENAFAKFKALLRKAAERTIDGLWSRIGELLPAFTPAECANYFAAAGYDAT